MKEENIKKEQSLEKGKRKKKKNEGKKTKYEVSEIEIEWLYIILFIYIISSILFCQKSHVAYTIGRENLSFRVSKEC